MTDRKARPVRIVIGVDFSAASTSAVRWASGWMDGDAELILVHALVIPDVSEGLALRMPLPLSLITNARAGAERRLRELSESLNVHRVAIEAREGRPADVIAAVARERNADLIIVGKHGEAGANRGYTGRTTDHLVRTSPAPVLVSDGMLEGAPRRIVVPVTYSSITPYIIDWTKRVYDASHADLFLIHVIGSAVLGHVLTAPAIKSGKDLTAAEIDEVFAEDRDRWKKELVKAGIPASQVLAEVVFGEVSEAILNAAVRHHAEMIVMGSHAGPSRRLLLGSAASGVLREAGIPVLIVVEPEPADIRDVTPKSQSKRNDPARKLQPA
jgi:nucleotide-binding universal stress UspA family protein